MFLSIHLTCIYTLYIYLVVIIAIKINQNKCTSAELQSSREGGTTLHNNISSNCVYELRIEGHFCSDSVFNLSRRILTETEIKVLEKGLNFAPIENKINELELQTNFNEFFRRMRTK